MQPNRQNSKAACMDVKELVQVHWQTCSEAWGGVSFEAPDGEAFAVPLYSSCCTLPAGRTLCYAERKRMPWQHDEWVHVEVEARELYLETTCRSITMALHERKVRTFTKQRTSAAEVTLTHRKIPSGSRNLGVDVAKLSKASLCNTSRCCRQPSCRT